MMGEEQELTLSDYGRIIKKRKWFLVSFFLVILISTYIYTKLQTPLYRSVIEVRIDKSEEEVHPLLGPLLALPELSTEMKIIKSLNILKKAVQNTEVLSTDPEVREQQITNLARGYQRSIHISQVENTNILSIHTTSSDPNKAAMLANAVVDAFSEEVFSSRGKQAEVVMEYTSKQLDDLRSRMKEAEKELLKFEQDEAVFVVTKEIKTILDRMTIEQTFEFENELFRLENDLDQIAMILRTKRNPVLEGLEKRDWYEDYVFTGLRRQLLELEFERFLLLIDYTHDHPNVIAHQEIILESQRNLKQLILTKVDDPLATQSGSDIELFFQKLFLQIKKEVIVRVINKFYSDIGSLSPNQLHYQELKRNVESMHKSYDKLLARQQNVDISFISDIVDIRVISPAVIPRKPIKPNMKVNLVVGSVVGFLLSLILIFILEGSELAISTIEDVERLIPIPILGMIPPIRIDDLYLMVKGGNKFKGDIIRAQLKSFITVFDSRSHAAESILTLRTNIMHIMESEQKKSFLITSPGQQEGKATIALNLAMSLSQLGKKTLLIEANFRKPSVDVLFGIDRRPGLSDVLMGRISWEQAIRTPTDLLFSQMDVDKLLENPGVDHLNVLTGGESVLNPSVILSSQKLGDLLDELKKHYDAIIILGTPVMLVADSTSLSKNVDGVVLSCQMMYTRKELLRRSFMHLKNVKADISGIVLNNVRPDALLGASVDFEHYYGEYDADKGTANSSFSAF